MLIRGLFRPGALLARPPGPRLPATSPRPGSAKHSKFLVAIHPYRNMTCGAFSTERDLKNWLETNGVDCSAWGTGLAKAIADLLEEQVRQESILDVVEGQALRVVRVLSLHVINNRGMVLYEDEQVLPDGRSRRRNVCVSEKLIGDEDWRAAVPRAVQEELGSCLPQDYQITLDDASYRRLEETSCSMSYPGLATKYIFHRVRAKVTGLPDGPFETYEPRPGGQLITRWVWRDPSSPDVIAPPTLPNGG